MSLNEDLEHEEFKDSGGEIRSRSKLPFQEVCLREALSLLDCGLCLLLLHFKLYQVNQRHKPAWPEAGWSKTLSS